MYALQVKLDCDFKEAVAKVSEALKANGFGVLTEIDVAATLKAKIGVERRPYVILGACNPPLANRGLELDPDLGILMPCNVVVREEEDGAIGVALMDTTAVFGLSSAAGMAEMAAEALEKLKAVQAALA